MANSNVAIRPPTDYRSSAPQQIVPSVAPPLGFHRNQDAASGKIIRCVGQGATPFEVAKASHELNEFRLRFQSFCHKLSQKS
jgi:hypothetical protein